MTVDDANERSTTARHRAESGLRRRDFLGAAAAGGLALSGLGGGIAKAAMRGSPASFAAAPKRGGTLNVGTPDGGSTDTCDGMAQETITDASRSFNLYDTLVYQTPTNLGAVESRLAEEISSNATADQWTVRLRPGVEFHNGKTLDADDLIFTMERVLNPKTGATLLPLFQIVDMKATKKLDNLTVRFQLTQPYGVMDLALGLGPLPIYPVGYDVKHPIGTGPFKFVSFTPGQQSVFAANENYWGGRPYVDELVITDLNDDTARVNAMLGGQIDMLVSVPYGSIPPVKADSKVDVIYTPSGSFYPIAMNCIDAPYTDVRVRQAMRLLADRPQMLEIAYSNLGRLGNDLYAIDDALYDSQLPQRHQDVDQAKSLLKQAGRLDDTFVLTSAPLGTGAVQSAQVFAQDAAQAGVKVRVSQIDTGTLEANAFHWPFVLGQWPANPYIINLQLADGPNAAYPETHFGDVDKPFASLCRQLYKETDASKRKELAFACQQAQYERGGYLLWGFQNLVDAASKSVAGYSRDKSGYSFGSFDFRLVYFT